MAGVTLFGVKASTKIQKCISYAMIIHLLDNHLVPRLLNLKGLNACRVENAIQVILQISSTGY